MNTGEGFQWGSVVLSFVGAVLAAYSTARFPVRLAEAMPTWWGSLVPAKVVLEQKAYSAGALLAISFAFFFQLLSLIRLSFPSGIIVLVAGFALAVGITIYTQRRRQAFVADYLRRMARQKDPQGELSDVARVKSPSNSEEFVEQIGLFYDLPRKRNERIEAYKQRLERHMRYLAGE